MAVELQETGASAGAPQEDDAPVLKKPLVENPFVNLDREAGVAQHEDTGLDVQLRTAQRASMDARTVVVAPAAAAQALDERDVIRRRSSSLRSTKVPPNEYYANMYGQQAVLGDIRAQFIRKVYSILTIQMAITVAMCAVSMYVDAVRDKLVDYAIEINRSVFYSWLLFAPGMIFFCFLSCNKNKYPHNFILLILFTVSFTVPTCLVCALYEEAGKGGLVISAFIITMALFMGLTLYACLTKRDFTWCGGILFMSLFGLIAVGFVYQILGVKEGLAWPIIGVIIFSLYVIYDTQRVLKIFGPDDAIMGAVELYLDIVNLFLLILGGLDR